MLLADELTAIGQYKVHSGIYVQWGYKRLHEAIENIARQEMEHAEKLIARILFLGGEPNPVPHNVLTIGTNVEQQLKADRDNEEAAIEVYNNSIQFMEASGDYGSAMLLRSILSEEEKHIDWLGIQLHMVSQVGRQNYLAKQID